MHINQAYTHGLHEEMSFVRALATKHISKNVNSTKDRRSALLQMKVGMNKRSNCVK